MWPPSLLRPLRLSSELPQQLRALVPFSCPSSPAPISCVGPSDPFEPCVHDACFFPELCPVTPAFWPCLTRMTGEVEGRMFPLTLPIPLSLLSLLPRYWLGPVPGMHFGSWLSNVTAVWGTVWAGGGAQMLPTLQGSCGNRPDRSEPH